VTKDEIIARLHHIVKDVAELAEVMEESYKVEPKQKLVKYAIGFHLANGTVAFVAGPYDTLDQAKLHTPEADHHGLYSIEPDKGECIVAMWDICTFSWRDV
jgi:hypothetical protein